MRRTEKVREAVKTLASMYAAWPTGPAMEGQPMPEGLNFGVSLKAVLEAREALSLLDGCVIVPREPNEAMQNRLTDLVKAMHADQHSRDMAAWEAIKGYRAMIAASEEGE